MYTHNKLSATRTPSEQLAGQQIGVIEPTIDLNVFTTLLSILIMFISWAPHYRMTAAQPLVLTRIRYTWSLPALVNRSDSDDDSAGLGSDDLTWCEGRT